LSSLKPNLYSHGSAVIGSIQLFVALMTARATALASRGLSQVDARTGVIRNGFLCGAVISLFAVACTFFVQKPSGQPEPGH
jgi:DHA2 family lincomycin resistance protein-like MFS transporter